MSKQVEKSCRRRIFIGDIHGCCDELQQLLHDIEHNPKTDELIFVGDLIAKGPKNEETVAFVRQLPNAFAVLGNHDYQTLKCAHFIKNWPNDLKFIQYPNCGSDPNTTEYHKKLASLLSIESIRYLASLPLYLELSHSMACVHAGVVPGIPLSEMAPNLLMNMRDIIADAQGTLSGTSKRDVGKIWSTVYPAHVEKPNHVFYGHDAVRGVQTLPYATGLDSGCVYGGYLSAAIVKMEDLQSDIVKKKSELPMTEKMDYYSALGFPIEIVKVRAAEVYSKPNIELKYLKEESTPSTRPI